MEQNRVIFDYLDNYIKYKKPQYAVMLSGAWGTGKTYLIKNWLSHVELHNPKKKCKPLYISLFGLHTIAELRSSINRLLYPVLTSKTMKTATKLVEGLAKTAIKYDFGTEKNPVEVSYELDLISLFKTDRKEIEATGKILVFDDLERCLINRIEILGFINFFVEQCGCKVIILCDEDKIHQHLEKSIVSKNSDTQWNSVPQDLEVEDSEYKVFKEKTIGVTFSVEPDIENALKSFIDEIASDPKDIVRNSIPTLSKMLRKASTQNLRIVRQSLYDFNYIVKSLLGSCQKFETFVPRMKQLLFDLVIIQQEMKSGNKMFDDVETLRYGFMNDSKQGTVSSLQSQYSDVPNQLGISILEYKNILRVVNFIKTYKYPVDELLEDLNNDERKFLPWEKLTYYWLLSNEEFETYYQATYSAIKDGPALPVQDLIRIAALLVNFEFCSIKELDHEFESLFYKRIQDYLSLVTTLDDLFALRRNIDGALSYNYLGDGVTRWMNILSHVRESFDQLLGNYQSRMTIALNNMRDESVQFLFRLIESSNPLDGLSYSSSPIFNYADPQKVAAGILSLSNKNRYQFKLLLTQHYSLLGSSNHEWLHYYDKEVDNVRKIVHILDGTKLTAIDRYSVDEIIKVFQQLLKDTKYVRS